ncbi:hypothetical protein CCAX7_62760 [Capsulimonas corticalis]|uniref:Uncharacterized protein n=2 Tax=Capsulimonas corticalis TaxID=2219043 RepID=A0A9N7QGI1_9BACT|nr:hypothetical protein CCAX7_62760 [Capsulimonas corticalis]
MPCSTLFAMTACAFGAVMVSGCGSHETTLSPIAIAPPPPDAIKPIAIPQPQLPDNMPEAQKQQIYANWQQQQQQINGQRQAMFDTMKPKK